MSAPEFLPTDTVIRIYGLGQNDSELVVIVPPGSRKQFKELVQRGTNLWPDASPEIKEFADLVTNGKVLQDYRAQAGNTVSLTTTKPGE